MKLKYKETSKLNIPIWEKYLFGCQINQNIKIQYENGNDLLNCAHKLLQN